MPIKQPKKLQIRSTQDTTFRVHYLNEWLEERQMTPVGLLNSLNDAANMDTAVIDKSQVYRWLKGQLPQKATQIRIAAALQLLDEDGNPDPELLTTDPTVAWVASRVKGRSKEEIQRVKEFFDLVLPPRRA